MIHDREGAELRVGDRVVFPWRANDRPDPIKVGQVDRLGRPVLVRHLVNDQWQYEPVEPRDLIRTTAKLSVERRLDRRYGSLGPTES